MSLPNQPMSRTLEMVDDSSSDDSVEQNEQPVNLKDINECYIIKITEGNLIKNKVFWIMWEIVTCREEN